MTVSYCPTTSGASNQSVTFTGGGGLTRPVTGTGNVAPTVPALLTPASGGTVTTLAPALVLTNSTDPEGNTITYDVTVDDPQVLLQPWVMNQRVLKLNPNPKATIFEEGPCRNYDLEIVSSRIR